MGVGKPYLGANFLIIAALLLSADTAHASTTFIDSIRTAMPWLDSTRHHPYLPSGGEGLWRPLLNFRVDSADCSEPLLTLEGRRTCLNGNQIFPTRNILHTATAGTPVAPDGAEPLIAVDTPDFNFANNSDVAYYSGLPPETIDSEELKVRPLWKDEAYDHTRSPTAGVTFLRSF